jgi:hypothetical protein
MSAEQREHGAQLDVQGHGRGVALDRARDTRPRRPPGAQLRAHGRARGDRRAPGPAPSSGPSSSTWASPGKRWPSARGTRPLDARRAAPGARAARPRMREHLGELRSATAAVMREHLGELDRVTEPGNREPARSAGHRRALRGRGRAPAPGRAAPRSPGPSSSGSRFRAVPTAGNRHQAARHGHERRGVALDRARDTRPRRPPGAQLRAHGRARGDRRAPGPAPSSGPSSSTWASPGKRWPSARGSLNRRPTAAVMREHLGELDRVTEPGNREPARSAGHRRALRGRGRAPAPGRAAPRSSGLSSSGSRFRAVPTAGNRHQAARHGHERRSVPKFPDTARPGHTAASSASSARGTTRRAAPGARPR